MRTRQESSFCCRLSNNFKWCITTALSSIIKPFRMINPVETIIAAGAMMGIMPIVSKQFHKHILFQTAEMMTLIHYTIFWR